MLQFLWPVFPASLKARLCKRIVVTGAESTGTTTLALALAEDLNCPYVPEYGREYTEKRANVTDAPWREDELVEIAREQNELEDAAARRSTNGWIVADTDALTTALWNERYFGTRSQKVDAIARQQVRPFAYILTSDDIAFEADAIREGGEERHTMSERFREELEASGVAWMEAKGGRQQRLDAALSFIRSL
ncbi:ATP-binding protein [Ponticaulis sp.]|uniref:ATP-binding protein n=1 Tax=Ponticaulis sp. TaxID=2020902 RepID=UPI000B75A46C|nr:ATP-binding protein [Ponticaulis sp.]MAI90337.1 hypothetical protein [Ponticaulis sp.]OUX99974.1 MAG: hypothetical protein CBB65_07845 [Hyphomonadaceae bacterium TMED5]